MTRLPGHLFVVLSLSLLTFLTIGISCKELQPYANEVFHLEEFLTAKLNAGSEGTAEYNGFNLTLFPDYSIFQDIFNGFGEVIKVKATCYACEVYMALLKHQIMMGTPEERLEDMVYITCTTFNITSPEVCRGVISRIGPTFYFIMENRPEITPKIACGMVLQHIGCSHDYDPYLDFTVDIDNEKAPSYEEKYEMMKIVHFTDVHFDLDYVTNSSVECENKVLCCHGEKTDNSSLQAGEYGSTLSCDAPLPLLVSSFELIKTLDADVMYMTGDIVPHNIWYSTQEMNTEIVEVFSGYLEKYLPDSEIVFCIGNHEPHPVNLYSPVDSTIPPELRTNWIFEATYTPLWRYLPVEYKTNSGNYVLNRKNLKIIVINTNVCYVYNLWQLYSPNDPMGVLKFLNFHLKEAEKEKKYVHIVGHVPPGHEDCHNTWSREFYKTVNRYKNTIKAQFYGHTHFDEFKVFSETFNKKEFVSVAFMGPSLTSYRIFNPGLKIYESFGTVDNFTSYVFDYNVNEWSQLYSSEELGVNGDSHSMGRFAHRMAKDEILFRKFYRYYNKGVKGQEEPCDNVCRKRVLCSLVRSNSYEESQECDNIQKEVDGVVLPLKILEEKKRRIWL